MSAIQRVSRLAPNRATDDPSDNIFSAAESPIVISHASFVGLGIIIAAGGTLPTLTVAVDGVADGAFTDQVTMLGAGRWRWPDQEGMNMLYNARFIKITWNTNSIQVFQKG